MPGWVKRRVRIGGHLVTAIALVVRPFQVAVDDLTQNCTNLQGRRGFGGSAEIRSRDRREYSSSRTLILSAFAVYQSRIAE